MLPKNFEKRQIPIYVCLAVWVLVLLFLISLYNVDVLLSHFRISVSLSYPEKYVFLTVFHFALAHVLLRRYKAGIWLFIVCIVVTLVVDCSTFWLGPNLVPLRAPIASLFPVLGVLLAFIFHTKSRQFFLRSLFAAIAFVMFVNMYIVPIAEAYQWRKQTPNVTQEINFRKFKTLDEKLVRFVDTIRTPSVLVECYFVGCPGCEVKYKLLKRLRANTNPDSLSIVMICAGNISKWDKFLAHAARNATQGVSFLYDVNNEMNAVLDNRLKQFPIEILYVNTQPKPLVTLGYQEEKLKRQYQMHLNPNEALK